MLCFEHLFGRKLAKHHSIQETQSGELRRAWILAIGKRDDVERKLTSMQSSAAEAIS